MGWTQFEIRILGQTDSHGGARQDESEALYALLRARIQAVLEDQLFTPLGPWMS